MWGSPLLPDLHSREGSSGSRGLSDLGSFSSVPPIVPPPHPSSLPGRPSPPIVEARYSAAFPEPGDSPRLPSPSRRGSLSSTIAERGEVSQEWVFPLSPHSALLLAANPSSFHRKRKGIGREGEPEPQSKTRAPVLSRRNPGRRSCLRRPSSKRGESLVPGKHPGIPPARGKEKPRRYCHGSGNPITLP